MLFGEGAPFAKRFLEFAGISNSQTDPAQRFNRAHVVDTVIADLRCIPILETCLNLEIHFVTCFSLTNEAEVRIIQKNHHEADAVLSSYCQLLDQKLHGQVSHDSDNFTVRFRELRSDAGRNLPAERPCLATNQVPSRVIDSLKLSRGDLIQANRRNKSGFVVEYLVDFLRDALGLDWLVFDVLLPRHGRL